MTLWGKLMTHFAAIDDGESLIRVLGYRADHTPRTTVDWKRDEQLIQAGPTEFALFLKHRTWR